MKLLAAIIVLAALTACSTGANPAGEPAPPAAAAIDKTCAEVRSGIDAFNTGDFGSTVAHFEKAERFAQAYADASDKSEADDLLEAVKYYAALPAKSYPKAARTSPEFARYKTITLGQCENAPEGDDGTVT